LNDGIRVYKYDAFNRLLEVYKTPGEPVLIGAYAYDAAPARRVRKTVSNGGLSGDIPHGTTHFLYYPGVWQVCEERDPTGEEDAPTKQYVWGTYIDELIQQKTYVETGEQPLDPGSYYPLQSPMYSAFALTDDEGDIVEAYDLDPYGNRIVF